MWWWWWVGGWGRGGRAGSPQYMHMYQHDCIPELGGFRLAVNPGQAHGSALASILPARGGGGRGGLPPAPPPPPPPPPRSRPQGPRPPRHPPAAPVQRGSRAAACSWNRRPRSASAAASAPDPSPCSSSVPHSAPQSPPHAAQGHTCVVCALVAGARCDPCQPDQKSRIASKSLEEAYSPCCPKQTLPYLARAHVGAGPQ
jgi:hypothetical protein